MFLFLCFLTCYYICLSSQCQWCTWRFIFKTSQTFFTLKETSLFHRNDATYYLLLVWGYGLLSITVISLLSLSVISMIPCLKKSFYHIVMAYLIALAVGTLAGDAMLHLIPHVSTIFYDDKMLVWIDWM